MGFLLNRRVGGRLEAAASEPRPSSIMKQKFYSQVNMECVFFF
jgi:hypothetical protein